jgi:adenosylcobinamide-GDP ribazoletransferase
VLARAAVLVPMNLFPAARAESLGARSREGNWTLGAVIALPAVLFAPGAAVAALAVALLVAWFAASRLNGGISGDVYGAIIEITEVTVLIAFLL